MIKVNIELPQFQGQKVFEVTLNTQQGLKIIFVLADDSATAKKKTSKNFPFAEIVAIHRTIEVIE